MNVKSWLAIAGIGALAVCTAVPATAESGKPDFGRTGPYLRGGVAAAFDLTSLIGSEVDTGVGLGVAAGYRVQKYIAAEALFHWLGKTDVNLGFGDTTIERWDALANVKISTAGRFQPYAAVGMGYGSYGVASGGGAGTLGGFVARFGAGMDVYITQHVGIYADAAYTLTTGDIEPFDYATLEAGAIFRF